jgi:hypothetical protein
MPSCLSKTGYMNMKISIFWCFWKSHYKVTKLYMYESCEQYRHISTKPVGLVFKACVPAHGSWQTDCFKLSKRGTSKSGKRHGLAGPLNQKSWHLTPALALNYLQKSVARKPVNCLCQGTWYQDQGQRSRLHIFMNIYEYLLIFSGRWLMKPEDNSPNAINRNSEWKIFRKGNLVNPDKCFL